MYYSEIFYSKGLVIKILPYFILPFIFIGCTTQPTKVSTATILIKTPNMKFYDKGFIYKYNDYTKVEVLNTGKTILSLEIHDNKICKDTFRCQSASSFNKEFLNENYKSTFLKELFDKNEKRVVFRDDENRILIKIIKD